MKIHKIWFIYLFSITIFFVGDNCFVHPNSSGWIPTIRWNITEDVQLKLKQGSNLPTDIGYAKYTCQISNINIISNGTRVLDDTHLKNHISIVKNENDKYIKVKKN